MPARLSPVLAVLVMAAAAAVTAAPAPMSPVQLIGVSTQGSPALSPDGRSVLFTRSSADWARDKQISHIWLATATAAPVQMTNGEDGEADAVWAADGRRFLFLARRGDTFRQVYVQSATGGEAIRLTDHATAVGDARWSPDGGTVYFLAEDAETREEKEQDVRIGGAYSFDRNYHQKHLWAVDTATGAERRVTEGAFSVRGYTISADGDKVVYEAAPTPLYDDADEGEVWIRELRDGAALQLTRNGVAESGGELSPDGGTVLFVADADQAFEPYHEGNVFTVPATGGAPRLLAADFPHEVVAAEWAADGSILVLANLGVTTQLFRLDPSTGALRPLTTGQHTIRGFSLVSARAEVAYVASSPSSPGDVWLAAPGQPAPRRLTRYAEELAASYRLPRTEVIHWKGADGQEVEGILTYPLDYREGQRVPLVTQVHGGPAASSTLRFPSWATYTPVLAAHGYAVLDPNYRGSTGYGDAFLRDMVGHYFHQAHKDVMAGVDDLIRRGFVDGDRMAKMGWSAGGHMTNRIITYTDRFKAASSGAGAANWISMYAQSDVRTYSTPWFRGTPWQKDAPIQRYLEASPFMTAYRVSTPTLILVGEKDVRVPMPQSVEMFRALRSNGVPTELVVFPREPHGPRELRHQLYKINKELSWFARYALGADYTMEPPPTTPAND